MHISSSYAKILGKQIFSLGSFPEVGQKQKKIRKKEKKERLNDGKNNGQLCITNATSGGTHKAALATMKVAAGK